MANNLPAKLNLQAEVVGIDLSPIQKEEWNKTGGCEGVILDIEDCWPQRQFDYVFCRDMSGSLKDWLKFVQDAYEYVENLIY
jgi:hypothetical protein